MATTQKGNYWISKTRGSDRVEIVRQDSGVFEVRVETARGDVIVERFAMSELAEIGLRNN